MLFRMTGLVSIALLFGGCAGTQQPVTAPAVATGSSTPTTPSSPSGSSSKPAAAIALQGVPPTTATVGTAYSFQPTVSAGGAVVTFTATGLPPWLSFNTSTGALTGNPVAKDEGTTGHITIAASDGLSSASITPFTIRVSGAPSAPTASIQLSWTAPTNNTDGTAITDLAGYHIYYGTSASELTKTIEVIGGASTTHVVAGLPAGTYYFSVMAYNAAGLRSGQSNVTSHTI
jgi:hypothetical protein